jgi:hypothetical protein
VTCGRLYGQTAAATASDAWFGIVQEIESIGFIDVWHGDTYNELRQSPILYSVFAQLLKTHRLVTSIDRYGTQAAARQCVA